MFFLNLENSRKIQGHIRTTVSSEREIIDDVEILKHILKKVLQLKSQKMKIKHVKLK